MDMYLYGAVTVGFDTGATTGALRGTPGRLHVHRSLAMPAVATVVTVDEAGVRAPDRRHWTGVYTLAGGTVPGRGAVVWTTRPTPARRAPEEETTTRIDRDRTTRIRRVHVKPVRPSSD
jgi:RND superfamily putative drug exporter